MSILLKKHSAEFGIIRSFHYKADETVPLLGRIRIGESMVKFNAKVNVPVEFIWENQLFHINLQQFKELFKFYL